MKAGTKFLYALQAAAGTGEYPDGYTSGSIKNVWQDIVATADNYYKPGTFTTFTALEWTSMPDLVNSHRTEGGRPEVQAIIMPCGMMKGQ